MKGINKIIGYIGLGVIVLSCLLLIVPNTWIFSNHSYNGYQFIFRASSWLENNNYGRPSAAGIISLILLLAAIPTCIFSTRSSAAKIFAGILFIVSGVLFITMQGWAILIYATKMANSNFINWPFYVAGALLLIYGLMILYLGVKEYGKEKQEAFHSSSYSYLKKNNKK